MLFQIMFFTYDQIPEVGLLTYEFNLMTRFETQKLGEHFRAVLESELLMEREKRPAVAFDGPQGSAKSTMVRSITGIEMNDPLRGVDKERPHYTNEDMWPMHNTIYLDGLGVVSWMDASWEHLQGIEGDLISMNRKAFSMRYRDIPTAGINLIEWPSRCKWKPEFSFYFDMRVNGGGIGKAALLTSREASKTPAFQKFLERTEDLHAKDREFGTVFMKPGPAVI